MLLVRGDLVVLKTDIISKQITEIYKVIRISTSGTYAILESKKSYFTKKPISKLSEFPKKFEEFYNLIS
ncbi:MAG: hypothetical protein ABIP51_04145 [Bacteroidia bacterium]